MRGLVKRWLAVAILVTVLAGLAFWSSRQRATVLNPHARVLPAGHIVVSSVPISSDQLVLLEVHDSGYSAIVRMMADEPSYDGFYARKGVLSRGEAYDSKPLVMRGRTKAAVNVEQDSSAINGGIHALLIDRFPWTYTTHGVPRWLNHRLTVTGMANDGAVTIAAGATRILLRPGGQVEVGRCAGFWRSTVTVRHRGLFEKRKVLRSKWLSVRTD